MAINYSGPSVPGGEVSPGSGSTGFSSAGVAFANSSGQLVSDSMFSYTTGITGQLRIPSTASATTVSQSGALVIGPSSVTNMGLSNAGIQVRSSAGIAGTLLLNSQGGTVITGASATFQVGTSNGSGKLSLPSTVNMTSAVGGAGAAAALPATPESWIKVLAPNNAGTLTTLYMPLFLSTG